MEMYHNQNDMLSAAQSAITLACRQYVSEGMDEEGLRGVLANIPDELWADAGASLSLVAILVEDEELYDFCLQKKESFAELICGFLPTAFWNNKEGILRFTEFIVDSMISWCSFATISDFEDILGFVPDEVRNDRYFTLSMIEMVAARENSLEWNGDFTDLIPESFLHDKDALLAVVTYIMGANQPNASNFDLVPAAAWEYSEIIFWILDHFRNEYESDHFLFTMYPVFRGSKRDYLESFLHFIPKRFKSDKSFVREFLEYACFFDELEPFYTWMDEGLWHDPDVVLQALEEDCAAILYVPREVTEVESVKKYVEEDLDWEWDVRGFSEEALPSWIREMKTK